MSPTQGRPHSDNPKSERLYIRVTPAEKAEIQAGKKHFRLFLPAILLPPRRRPPPCRRKTAFPSQAAICRNKAAQEKSHAGNPAKMCRAAPLPPKGNILYRQTAKKSPAYPFPLFLAFIQHMGETKGKCRFARKLPGRRFRNIFRNPVQFRLPHR